jgi:uncharacterized small protein (DUF1192 family)
MTDQPTPETDAMFTDNVPEDAQIVAFCERLERERNAARAERDAANAFTLSLCADMDGDVQNRDDEIAVLRADVARLRAALEGIAEYGKLCNPGTATDCARLIYLAKQALSK